MPYVGQRIVVRTRDGASHDGYLHSVTHDGIYLRPATGGRTSLAVNTESKPSVLRLSDLPDATDDVSEAWFPFFFLPFFALAAFSPWGWWW